MVSVAIATTSPTPTSILSRWPDPVDTLCVFVIIDTCLDFRLYSVASPPADFPSADTLARGLAPRGIFLPFLRVFSAPERNVRGQARVRIPWGQVTDQ